MTWIAESSGGAKRVAFYGGSFDPPHRAHLAIASAARQALELNRVLFAPVGAQPLKPWGGAASFEDRVAMTRLAIAEEPGFEICLLDAPQAAARPNYSVDTLTRLKAGLGADSQLFCLVGADSLLDLHSWHRAAELPFVATLVVAGRPGVALEGLAALLPEGVAVGDNPAFGGLRHGVEVVGYELSNRKGEVARLILLPALDDDANATELRNLLEQRSGRAETMLSAAVLDYIRAHNLYK